MKGRIKMAERPAWTIKNGKVVEEMFAFKWNGGFAISQKRKNISGLYNAIKEKYDERVLEVSTKSEVELGNELSAFNLKLDGIYLECIFQGAKKYEQGGPFTDLYKEEPKKAKTDVRHKNSGDLQAFVYDSYEWELNPKTAFYDYIYIKAVLQNKGKMLDLMKYDWFTDIEFNPKKSVNSQARALAIYKLMQMENKFDCLNNVEDWIRFHRSKVEYNIKK